MFNSGKAIVLKRNDLIESDQSNPEFEQQQPMGSANYQGTGF